MSPERLNGEEYSCDIWSVGMMTMQCITGTLPFEFDAKKMSMIEYI
jgi:serine/threonine protein kinase